MSKTELIERIIDTFTDMGAEDPVDTAFGDLLTLAEAELYLNELRDLKKSYAEPDDWIFDKVTPQIYMEAHNCYLRKCRHDVTLERLAEFFTLHEMIDTYHEFDGKYISHTDKIVYPTDWLTEYMEFPFTSEDLTMLDLITLGQNSPDFDPEKDYCWYDGTSHKIHSTDTPFADGLIDARAFAEWILEDSGRIEYVQDWCMVDTDIDYIFNYWKTANEEG